MAHISILKFKNSSPADTLPLKDLEAAGYKVDRVYKELLCIRGA